MNENEKKSSKKMNIERKQLKYLNGNSHKKENIKVGEIYQTKDREYMKVK